jgi:hypothetical protein
MISGYNKSMKGNMATPTADNAVQGVVIKTAVVWSNFRKYWMLSPT